MSTPATTIYLCSGVPLTNRYDHTIRFSTPAAQQSYFASKTAKTFSSYAYARKTWSIKVSSTFEAARVWSYLYFRNGTGKWFYYFINQCEYVNDATVELSLELDVIQTYMFDWSLNPCFIERQHSPTDIYGENTIAEGLDTGDLVINASEDIGKASGWAIMVQSTFEPNTATESTKASKSMFTDSVFSGVGVYAVNSSDWNQLGEALSNFDSWGYSEGIVSMWMYPKQFITLATSSQWDDEILFKQVASMQPSDYTLAAIPTSVDGYSPKNKKTLQYPYNFLYISNNNGAAATYHYEKWNGREFPVFRYVGSASPEGVAKLFPRFYKGAELNYEEGLTLTGFPTCAWNVDVYKLWLAQNQHQQATAFASAGLKIVGGIAATAFSGGMAGVAGGGLVVSGISDITSQLAQRADMEIQPAQARGAQSGTLNMVVGKQCFTAYQKSVDKYHARVIDDYFTMFGYACRKVDTPNISARPNWTYVKTVGSNVTGDFAQEDIRRINEIFDHGITFWSNGATVGDYSIDNSP